MGKDMRIVLEVKGYGLGSEADFRKGEENMFLARFLRYEKICIQCHDNPDADALASGYALYYYFRRNGRSVELVYGGKNTITKPNLLLMIRELQIPVKHVTELPECDLLITADCQYGAGNVTHFEAPVVAMVDHHQCGIMQDENSYIRSNLVSCSTVVWDLFRQGGIDVNENLKLSTALYYGLYSDSNQFEELFHPLDKDARDSLQRDDALLFQLMNTNLSLSELGIASRALNGQIYNGEYHVSIIETELCDPNILGIISDFVIQVEEVDTCVAFNRNSDGYKLSVRSCIPAIKANELAMALCEGIGNGGGHLRKAGGFIAVETFEKLYPDRKMADVLEERIRVYQDSYEIIYAERYEIDMTGMERYAKKPVLVGYAKATDFLKEGTPILVRTLEGDVDLVVQEGLYLMIGIEGEVYPINQEKFERSYREADEIPEIETDYAPTIRDNIYGNIYQLTECMKPCIATGETKIYAKKLEKNVKVFTAWDKEKYYRGLVGDYIVVREDDAHDIYVVRGDIFLKTYEKL